MRLVEYRHPRAGFTVPLPSDWKQIEDLQRGVAVVAVEPERGRWFRANAVVTVEQVAPDTPLAGWHAAAAGQLPESLHEFVLLDLEDTEVAGHPARRLLGHHTTEAGAVTLEQWALRQGGQAYTLTVSVATLEYDDIAELSASIALGFRPAPEEEIR